MTNEEVRDNVKTLEKQLKKPITIKKYKRCKIVQEEIIEAFKTPVPNSITLANGKVRQVEKDNWIVLHQDGTQSTYTDEEFSKVFEAISLGEAFKPNNKMEGSQSEQASPNE